MKSIDELGLEDFEKRVGESFTLDGVKAELKAVESGKAGHKKFRTPVSLIFETETELSDASDALTLDHADLGAVELAAQRIQGEGGEDAKPTYQIALT